MAVPVGYKYVSTYTHPSYVDDSDIYCRSQKEQSSLLSYAESYSQWLNINRRRITNLSYLQRMLCAGQPHGIPSISLLKGRSANGYTVALRHEIYFWEIPNSHLGVCEMCSHSGVTFTFPKMCTL
jgi:hypothetical protein